MQGALLELVNFDVFVTKVGLQLAVCGMEMKLRAPLPALT